MLKPKSNPKLNWDKWEEIDIPQPLQTGSCRYCKHEQWEHRLDEKGNGPCREGMYNLKCRPIDDVTIIIPRDSKSRVCPCMEYVPGDNLAYLEWKEKRGY